MLFIRSRNLTLDQSDILYIESRAKRLAEESALRRKMMAQETDRRYYQSRAVSIAAYEAAGILK